MNQPDEFLQAFNSWASKTLLLQLVQFLAWTLFILLVGWLIRKGINRSVEGNAVRYRAKKITRIVGYVLILLLALVTFTGKVQYFTIAVGLASAGLAFALQEVILSVAGWVAIFASNLYKPGDRIEIHNVKGDVIDIGITKTTLMEIGEWVKSDNYSGRIVQVSNGFVFKGPVCNYSTDFPFVWDEINVPVRHGSDLDLAGRLIGEAANAALADYAGIARDHWKRLVRKYLIEDANTDPTVTLKLTDNWAAFNLRYVVDFKKRRSTKDRLFKDIHRALQLSGGKVMLASATFEVVGMPGIEVDLKDRKL